MTIHHKNENFHNDWFKHQLYNILWAVRMPPAGKRKANNAMLKHSNNGKAKCIWRREEKKWHHITKQNATQRETTTRYERANFEDKTRKVLRSQNNKIAHKKTKNKNKINKKKGLAENKQGKNEKGHRIGVKKWNFWRRKKTRGKNGRESNLKKKKRKHRKHIAREVRRTW